MLDPHPLQELAHLAPDAEERSQQLEVRLARDGAEELEDPEALPAEGHGERELAVEAGLHRGGLAGKVVVLLQVLDPGPFHGRPDAPPGRPSPGRTDPPGRRVETVEPPPGPPRIPLQRRTFVSRSTSQSAPQHQSRPCAGDLDDAPDALLEVRDLGQHFRDRELRRLAGLAAASASSLRRASVTSVSMAKAPANRPSSKSGVAEARSQT